MTKGKENDFEREEGREIMRVGNRNEVNRRK